MQPLIKSFSKNPSSPWTNLYHYPPNAYVNTVQYLVQWGSDALSGGDGALWTLLLHICEETLRIGKIFDVFAVVCGNIQPELLPAQDTLHPSELAGGRRNVWRRGSCFFPGERSIPELHSIAGILHFDQNNLPVIHHKEPLQRQRRWSYLTYLFTCSDNGVTRYTSTRIHFDWTCSQVFFVWTTVPQLCRIVLNSYLKSSDGNSTFWQWPHSQWCDFEGKGHGVENSNHSKSLRESMLTSNTNITRMFLMQLVPQQERVMSTVPLWAYLSCSKVIA